MKEKLYHTVQIYMEFLAAYVLRKTAHISDDLITIKGVNNQYCEKIQIDSQITAITD